MSSDLDKAVATCVWYFAHRPGVRRRLATLVGAGLRAQSLENDRGSGTCTVVFCWVHGQDVADCERQELFSDPEKKRPCVGDTIPTATDVTGEAGSSPDSYRRLLDECDRAESKLSLACGVGRPATPSEVVARLSHDPPRVTHAAAKVFDRAILVTGAPSKPPKGKSHDGRPGCGSCARLNVDGVPWFNEPDYIGGRLTDLAGSLKRKVRLCRACERFAADLAKRGEPVRLPTVEELERKRATGYFRKYATPGSKAS